MEMEHLGISFRKEEILAGPTASTWDRKKRVYQFPSVLPSEGPMSFSHASPEESRQAASAVPCSDGEAGTSRFP